MFKFLTLLFSIILTSESSANVISNLVEPVSYFSGREAELKILSDNLARYKKASIVGISGIGKTQLIRTFTQNNNYKLVWFFDCNRDFDAQYLNLAKHINQTIKDKNLSISEDYAGIKERVLDHLKPKKDWLLVYDNLKLGQNDLIKDIIELEANGNIIIGSQDGTNLPYAIYLQPLKETESIKIIHKILPDKQHANHLIDSAKGYPLLVARGAMLLKADSYLFQDYKQLLLKQQSSIKSYVELLMSSLSYSEKDTLYKISVINYQNFSKHFLQKIIDYPDKFEHDLYHLMQLGLIINTKSTDENEIFEMHEAIREQIISSASPRVIRNVIGNVIDKINKMMPIPTAARYSTFSNDQTMLANFEKLLFNAELYKVEVNKILSLREKLISFYISNRDFTKCQEMTRWISNYEKHNYWRLWLMDNEEKAIYASYLNCISIYEEWFNHDYASSISLKNKAKDILKYMDGYNEYKFISFIQLALLYIQMGNMEEADKNLTHAQQFAKNIHEEKMVWVLKIKILFAKGEFIKALDNINNMIAQNKNIDLNLFVAPVLVLKAKILNYTSSYQEAYDILNKVLALNNNKHSDLLTSVLVELSRASLGMGKAEVAGEYAKNAKYISLRQNKKDNTNFLLSQDWHLASALKTEADCLIELGIKNYTQAITLYAQAEAIFYNVYRENMKNSIIISDLYFNAAKAACKSKDKFWFNKFTTQHLAKFGFDNVRSKEILNMQCF